MNFKKCQGRGYSEEARGWFLDIYRFPPNILSDAITATAAHIFD
jgi:hypothetical protein